MEARPRRQSMKEKEHQVVVRNEEQKSEQEEGKVAQREEELEETGNQHNDVEIEEAGEDEEKEIGIVHSDAEKEQEFSVKQERVAFIALLGKGGHCEPMTSRLTHYSVSGTECFKQSMVNVLVVGSFHREGVCFL